MSFSSHSLSHAIEDLLDAAESGDQRRVSAILLAMAVGRGLLTLAEGEELARSTAYDPLAITAAVAPRLAEAGLVSRAKLREILRGQPG